MAVLTGTLIIALTGAAAATVLDFEDLVGYGAMPNPYQGIILWEEGSWFYYDQAQNPYNAASGSQRTYESLTDTTPSWQFLTPVIFTGAYFAGESIVGGKTVTVQMDLYRGDTLVHQTQEYTPSATPTFFATGYAGQVDKVVINTSKPDYWVMDDLTYTQTPVPAAVWLLGAGLAALAGRRWRQR